MQLNQENVEFCEKLCAKFKFLPRAPAEDLLSGAMVNLAEHIAAACTSREVAEELVQRANCKLQFFPVPAVLREILDEDMKCVQEDVSLRETEATWRSVEKRQRENEESLRARGLR
jgi:hypothetical protein